MPSKPTLFIFSGLPASGKTTLAKGLARKLPAVYLRIDTVEQGLRDLCACSVQGEGYRLSYRLAADNLDLGLNVVADSCNPWALTRREWEKVATDRGVAFRNIEIICSDRAEHEQRANSRKNEIPGLILPNWEQILARNFQPWTGDRIVIDTAGKTAEESLLELLKSI